MFLGAKIALAQTLGAFPKMESNPAVKDIVTKIVVNIVAPLIQGLFVLAGLIFIWGVFGFISKAADSTAQKEGKDHILWGIIGMFIMISAYGIIRLIGNTVGVGDPFL